MVTPPDCDGLHGAQPGEMVHDTSSAGHLREIRLYWPRARLQSAFYPEWVRFREPRGEG